MDRNARTARDLGRDSRGAVSTEYVVLVGTVGLVLAAAIAALGPGLVADFFATRSVVAAPYP